MKCSNCEKTLVAISFDESTNLTRFVCPDDITVGKDGQHDGMQVFDPSKALCSKYKSDNSCVVAKQ